MKRFVSMVLTVALAISLLNIPVNASPSTKLEDVARSTVGKSYSDLGLPSSNWCCYFIGYCVNNSIVSSWSNENISRADSANPMTLINWVCSKKNIGTFFSFSKTHYNRLIKKYENLSIVSTTVDSFTPSAGDILIVDWDGRGDSAQKFSHAGIVSSYNTKSKTITFVDGNTKTGSFKYVLERGPWPNNYNSIIGYIRFGAQDISAKTDNSSEESTLSINSPAYPGTLKQGSRYSLKGTIASNYNITSVKVEILNSEGNVVFSYTQRPNSKSFSLLNSKLDANMKFNELSPGKYYLTYTAEDASGRPEGKKAWSSEFTIAGEEKTPSTLKIVADSYPSGAIKEGSRYSLKGTISSNYSIVSVKGEIVDSNGSVMFSYTQRPNTKSFSILNSKLDANMKFNELSPGEYCLKYTAEDESGEQKTWSSGSFTVQGTKAERTYTVTFDANGGSVSPRTKIITADELIGALPTPVREGYDFVGWGTSRSSNMIVTPDNFWVEEDITLYAHWWQQPTEQTPDDGKADEQPSGGNADPEPERGYWKEWSEWSPARVTSSSTRRVETREALVSESRTEYRYVRYADATGTHICWCAKYLESRPYVSGKASLQYSDWNTTRYNSNGKGWSCGYCNGSHIGSDKTGSDGRSWWAEYVLPSGSYYWEESRTIPATYETQYRYSDWISG